MHTGAMADPKKKPTREDKSLTGGARPKPSEHERSDKSGTGSTGPKNAAKKPEGE
jgi:hypothetical protein